MQWLNSSLLQQGRFASSLAIILPCILIILLIVVDLLRSYFKLRRIPGPFLAAWSNIPRFYWVWTRRAHEIHIALHEQYGKLVRVGPNTVSVGDPAEIHNIYGITGKFQKSDFYHVILSFSKGKVLPGMFATQDEKLHRQLKRPIASIYSMSNLVSFEKYIDSTMRVFFEQLDRRFVQTGQTCDFGVWIQMFAFDVIGEITFSKRLGFLERAEDVDGIMAGNWNHFEYTAPVGQMPWLDRFWKKNTILSYLRSTPTNPAVTFAIERMNERRDQQLTEEEFNSRDFLSRFMEAKAKDPQIPEWAVVAWTQSNITAGSDTTAILLRTIFYNLLKYPQTLQRLLSELQNAANEDRLSDLVTWKEARDLQYLDACVKEAGRLHPPFGLQLERVVPAEGSEICGERFEQGTIVGINAWVVHRDKGIFGDDVETWRPERWLCDENKRKAMEHSLLTFGAGHRSCIGKNISLLEIYKLVPTLLHKYEIELADPNLEWRVENCWFVAQTGLKVRLRQRTGTGAGFGTEQ